MNIIGNIWNQTWEMRQAMRSVANGYSISALINLAIMVIYEMRYK